MTKKNFYSVYNPFSNEKVSDVEIHSEKEINNILDNSFHYKSELSTDHKIKLFQRTIDTLKNEINEFANLIVSETGLSINSGIYEVKERLIVLNIVSKKQKD